MYYVYLLASKMHGTLYLGVTNDLGRRVWEHREGKIRGFTKKHGVHRLVWYVEHARLDEAMAAEKRMNRWHRDWKVQLVEAENPLWTDLYPTLPR